MHRVLSVMINLGPFRSRIIIVLLIWGLVAVVMGIVVSIWVVLRIRLPIGLSRRKLIWGKPRGGMPGSRGVVLGWKVIVIRLRLSPLTLVWWRRMVDLKKCMTELSISYSNTETNRNNGNNNATTTAIQYKNYKNAYNNNADKPPRKPITYHTPKYQNPNKNKNKNRHIYRNPNKNQYKDQSRNRSKNMLKMDILLVTMFHILVAMVILDTISWTDCRFVYVWVVVSMLWSSFIIIVLVLFILCNIFICFYVILRERIEDIICCVCMLDIYNNKTKNITIKTDEQASPDSIKTKRHVPDPILRLAQNPAWRSHRNNRLQRPETKMDPNPHEPRLHNPKLPLRPSSRCVRWI